MPPDPLQFVLFLNQLQIRSAVKKKTLKKIVEIINPPPLLKFLATPLPALVIGEKNLVIDFGPPHFRNASVIAGYKLVLPKLDARPLQISH